MRGYVVDASVGVKWLVTADTRFHEKVSRHPYLGDRIVHVGDL